jgi:hypothetical protein
LAEIASPPTNGGGEASYFLTITVWAGGRVMPPGGVFEAEPEPTGGGSVPPVGAAATGPVEVELETGTGARWPAVPGTGAGGDNAADAAGGTIGWGGWVGLFGRP